MTQADSAINVYMATSLAWRQLSSCSLRPAGVFMWVFFLGTFTHPDIWDDPDAFRPVSSRCDHINHIKVMRFTYCHLSAGVSPW
jgi:hypothetical protein